MATNADIKNALSFPADEDTLFIQDGRTVGNPGLVRVKACFEAEYAEELGGREANANDFAAWLWRQIAARVKTYERRVAEQALAQPDELDDTA